MRAPLDTLDARDRLVAHVAAHPAGVPTDALVAWMRAEGWTRGQGEWDLLQLRRHGRLYRSVTDRRYLAAS